MLGQVVPRPLRPVLTVRYDECIVLPGYSIRSKSYRSTRLVFFFQEEDGIRGSSGTGVQTCALPIWSYLRHDRGPHNLGGSIEVVAGHDHAGDKTTPPNRNDDGVKGSVSQDLFAQGRIANYHARSEERRVGKECRSRWSPYH